MSLAFRDKEMAKILETVPHSNRRLARRVIEISENVSSKFEGVVQQ